MQFASRAGSDTAPPWGISGAHRQIVDDVIDDALRRCGPSLAVPITRIFRGGKRLRPAVTIAAAGQHASAQPGPAVVAAAAAIELLHWATLVHDDVMDDASSRHGQPTVNAQEGTAQAIVTGDLLIGTAFDLAGRAGLDAARLLATALTQLCVGQAREDAHRYNPGTTEDDVLAAISGKTGSLIAAAAQVGGVIAGRSVELVHALGEFGMAFGVSLQLLDDVLDLVSSRSLLGKPVLADFSAGAVTLPAVAAMRRQPQLRELLRPGMSPSEGDRAADLLRDPEVLLHAAGVAGQHADRAEAILSAHISPRAHDADSAALRALAAWPRAYLVAQLESKVEPRWAFMSSSFGGRPVPAAQLAG